MFIESYTFASNQNNCIESKNNCIESKIIVSNQK
nr:MAG TPA: hypothetical protein [Caudoviricetes sp.]